MFCTYSHVRLAAVNAWVPPNEISIMDELEYYGGKRKKVERLRRAIGLNTRRVCPDGVTASDLCFQAASELLDSNGIAREEIEALLFLSQTPDYQMPSTACVLQDRLGLSRECAAIDLSQGCSGYVYGLWMAAGRWREASSAEHAPRDAAFRSLCQRCAQGHMWLVAFLQESDESNKAIAASGTSETGIVLCRNFMKYGLLSVPTGHRRGGSPPSAPTGNFC